MLRQRTEGVTLSTQMRLKKKKQHVRFENSGVVLQCNRQRERKTQRGGGRGRAAQMSHCLYLTQDGSAASLIWAEKQPIVAPFFSSSLLLFK